MYRKSPGTKARACQLKDFLAKMLIALLEPLSVGAPVLDLNRSNSRVPIESRKAIMSRNQYQDSSAANLSEEHISVVFCVAEKLRHQSDLVRPSCSNSWRATPSKRLSGSRNESRLPRSF
jgi:hypothetical protein